MTFLEVCRIMGIVSLPNLLVLLKTNQNMERIVFLKFSLKKGVYWMIFT